MIKFQILTALSLEVKIAPKLIFGACPEVDRVERANPDGYALIGVGKWYLTEVDMDVFIQGLYKNNQC